MGACVLPTGSALEGEVLPWLKSRKMRKYMGKQDELAVIAAGRALEAARLHPARDGARIGLYLCVGYIPFERADIDVLTASSIRDGRFSMELFSTVAVEQVNPLLTFRCLPNMPIFHVSLNFGICGPYFVTYPGIGQFYLALERAVAALRCGEIDQALVGGVADQNNFLVDYHFSRQGAPRLEIRHDVGAVLCLEKSTTAGLRGVQPRAELAEMDVRYQAPDPLGDALSCTHDPLGPASLACALEAAPSGELAHAVKTADGFVAASRWRLS
jgi:hypothetical protein